MLVKGATDSSSEFAADFKAHIDHAHMNLYAPGSNYFYVQTSTTILVQPQLMWGMVE